MIKKIVNNNLLMNHNPESTNAKIVAPKSFENLNFICNQFDSPISSQQFLNRAAGICYELPHVNQQKACLSHGVEDQEINPHSS